MFNKTMRYELSFAMIDDMKSWYHADISDQVCDMATHVVCRNENYRFGMRQMI